MPAMPPHIFSVAVLAPPLASAPPLAAVLPPTPEEPPGGRSEAGGDEAGAGDGLVGSVAGAGGVQAERTRQSSRYVELA